LSKIEWGQFTSTCGICSGEYTFGYGLIHNRTIKHIKAIEALNEKRKDEETIRWLNKEFTKSVNKYLSKPIPSDGDMEMMLEAIKGYNAKFDGVAKRYQQKNP
jgi:hypothetical protein